MAMHGRRGGPKVECNHPKAEKERKNGSQRGGGSCEETAVQISDSSGFALRVSRAWLVSEDLKDSESEVLDFGVGRSCRAGVNSCTDEELHAVQNLWQVRSTNNNTEA